MNSKTRIFLSLFLYLSIFGNSILAQKTSNLSFGIGLSTPLGRLAKTNFYDSTNGYGTGAICYTLRYERTNTKGWGSFVDFQNASINFNADKYISDTKQYLGPGWNWVEYNSIRYNVKTLNSGVQFTFNKDQKFKLTGFLGLGIGISRKKYLDYTFTYGGNSIKGIESSEKSAAININIGFKASYDLNNKLALHLKFNYLGNSAYIKNNYQIYRNGFPYSNFSSTYIQPMSMRTITLGVTYNLSGGK